MDLIITLNNKKKNWTRKYHRIIQGLKTMTKIQLQIQEMVKLANAANIELTDIKTALLQSSNIYKEQIGEDIYSITNNLQNIVYRDMEKQAYHIQILLTDKLDQYKGKEDKQVEEYIKIIQETY